MGPRWGQDGAKMGQDGPRWGQDRPRWGQDGPKTCQDEAKMELRRAMKRPLYEVKKKSKKGEVADFSTTMKLGFIVLLAGDPLTHFVRINDNSS